MSWNNLSPYVGAALLFLAMQVAPSLKTLTDHLVLARIKKKDRDRETSASRADEAAKDCFGELASLLEAIPEYARLRFAPLERDEVHRRDEAKRIHDSALGRLEANLTLLPPTTREAMAKVLDILRCAHDLPIRESFISVGYHPDSSWTIAETVVRYGREILARHLRREGLPAEPDVIHEYVLALQDRDAELTGEFAEELHEERVALRDFRTGHGLPAERGPWPGE